MQLHTYEVQVQKKKWKKKKGRRRKKIVLYKIQNLPLIRLAPLLLDFEIESAAAVTMEVSMVAIELYL